ncbi:MAG: IS1380 family transposase [Pseudonocardia sp.]|nr:IS1380 family transposase [Pseudonocardia sp.]
MEASHRVRPVFDDPNLVGSAGLVPALLLSRAAGLDALAQEHLEVDCPNAEVKTTALVAGMVAGAKSIDAMDRLRHGAMPRLFTGIVAPSTIGTYLRAFTQGQIAQLDAVASRFLVGLIGLVGGLLAGVAGRDGEEGIVFVDVDDTIRQVYGYAKQGAAYGYSKVKGLNAQLAVFSTPLSAPVIAAARLRRGNVASASGSARLLARALATARAAGVSCRVMVRADSAYFNHAFIATARRAGAWFSVTARLNPKVKAAIATIPADAWTAIKYPKAVWDDQLEQWVSEAEVAEIDFVAFTSRKKKEHIGCRLVVRRVKRLQKLTSDGTGQGELFAAYRYHGFVTNSTLSTVEADERHRDHAIIEQVIAELKAGALAHLPSGKKTANSAWLAHTVMAFNLARATAVLAGRSHARSRWATIRTQLINVPARVATSGRRTTLHLPRDWAWAGAWEHLHTQAKALLLGTGPPPAAAA